MEKSPVLERFQRYVKIAESLGLSLEIHHDAHEYLFILKHEASNSEFSTLSGPGCQLLDFLNTCRWAVTSQELEERVAKLEQQLNVGRYSGTPAYSQAEYEHYLNRFQQKAPEFEAAGITLTIDEQAQQVTYVNSAKRAGKGCMPITYHISKSGYNAAVNALISQRNRDRCKD